MTPRARAAYDWLMVHIRTYRRHAMQQKRMLSYPGDEREMFIATYRLLLQSRGIEVALFPVLFWEVYSDSDVRGWAGDRKLMKSSQLPSMKKAFLRKRAENIYHLGCIRRTDWLPVSMKRDDPEEQTSRTAQSESDDEYGPRLREMDTESDSEAGSSDVCSDCGEVDENQRAAMFEELAASPGSSDLSAFAPIGVANLI
ncbi:unnamed protein product [Prorocentrum cordatum]|uniref:RAP domain-containing protein n=1 Tax=Prorocentrum cordatum TaxID=2364126 RepID=A0ABN9V402_9DINO|nr:unnamed protein product [Polarella glacialis]